MKIPIYEEALIIWDGALLLLGLLIIIIVIDDNIAILNIREIQLSDKCSFAWQGLWRISYETK